MQVIVALGGGCFLLICVVGGARLLLLARRTRQLPEFVLGLGLFLMGGVGTPAVAIAQSPLQLPDEVRSALMLFQGLILSAGFGAFALFTQRVFRPDTRWAQILAFALPGVAFVSVLAMMLEPDGVAKAVGRGAGGPLGLAYLGQQLAGLMVLCWTAFEALKQAGMLHRRLALGLADAVVTNRVQLWGGAMAVAALMNAVSTAFYVFGLDPMASLTSMGLLALLGITAAAGICLAFLPPKPYLSWVRRRAASLA